MISLRFVMFGSLFLCLIFTIISMNSFETMSELSSFSTTFISDALTSLWEILHAIFRWTLLLASAIFAFMTVGAFFEAAIGNHLHGCSYSIAPKNSWLIFFIFAGLFAGSVWVISEVI